MKSRFASLALVVAVFGSWMPAFAQPNDTPTPTPTLILDSGNSSGVKALAFDPNGRWIATSGDATIKIWELATGHLLRTLTGHTDLVQAISVSPDGRRLVSSSRYDKSVKVWDVESGQLLRSLSRSTPDNGQAFSPDGVALSRDGRTVVATGIYVARWDIESGKSLNIFRTFCMGPPCHPFPNTANGSALALSSDGALLVLGYGPELGARAANTPIGIWDLAAGKLIRMFRAHSGNVHAVALSPDGRWIVSGGDDKSVKLWNLASGQLLRTFEGHPSEVRAIAFSPDGRRVASVSDHMLNISDATSGRLLKSINFDKDQFESVAFSPDGKMVATGLYQFVMLWDADSGTLVRSMPPDAAPNTSTRAYLTVAPDNRWIVSSAAGMTFWDPATGQLVESYRPDKVGFELDHRVAVDAAGRWSLPVLAPTPSGKNWTAGVGDVKSGQAIRSVLWSGTESAKEFTASKALSNDGRLLAVAAIQYDLPGAEQVKLYSKVKLFDVASGQLVRILDGGADVVQRVMFSPDGRLLATVIKKSVIRLWDVATGNLVKEIQPPNMHAFAFSPDGRRIVMDVDAHESRNWTSGNQYEIRLLDVATGQFLWSTRHGFTDIVSHFAVSPNGELIVSSHTDNDLRVWNAANGQRVRTLQGSPGISETLVFSQDGGKIAVGNVNRTTAVWSAATGDLLTTTVHAATGEWITITPEGFFVASDKGAALLHVTRGFETIGIDQFYQSLYRPDLVREKLAGDPRGIVREAAAQLDLTKILASGNAPAVRVVSPLDGANAASGQITAEVEIAEHGGGIGRVEWRVNGVTVGVDAAPAAPSAGQPLRQTRVFTLDEGNNEIEVVAYNATNLIASVPVRATVTGPAPATAAPARLFVLAVGLNDYADAKFKLTYAVQDAKALADALQVTGKGLYSEVNVTLVQDADARRDKIDAIFTELAGKVKPTDLFVFYIAGHGKTVDGRYYFVPQDFHFDGDRTSPAEIDKAVVAQGVGQARWQTWFARIAAKKSVLLFDTCEAGTLAEDKATRALERGAANDRLAQLTGRTIITASASDKEAIEGFHDHGLFTYSVLEALERADSNGDGKIDVAEFATYVHAQVSVLSEKVFKQRQVPQVRIISNYPFATPARVLPQAAPDMVIPEKPTHQVSAEAQLLVLPAVGARQVRKLDAKTPLTLVGSEGGWSLVATHGQPIGYLATRELAPIQ